MSFWHRLFMTFHSFVGIDFYTAFYMRFPWKIPPFQLPLAPFRLPFGSVGVLLAPFRLPFGSILAPFSVARKWYIPLGAHWLPLAPFQLHFGTRWLTFGSLLAPFGSHLAPSGVLFLPLACPSAKRRLHVNGTKRLLAPPRRSREPDQKDPKAMALRPWR